jgi:hypothetical protein
MVEIDPASGKRQQYGQICGAADRDRNQFAIRFMSFLAGRLHLREISILAMRLPWQFEEFNRNGDQ